MSYKSVTTISFYLLMWLGFLGLGLLSNYVFQIPTWYIDNLLAIRCIYIAGIGGILYLIRSIYWHKCFHDNWDKNYSTWYYLRPFSSCISGFVSYLFLKSGLLILGGAAKTSNQNGGYLAIAFIAGYNVSRFLDKIQSVVEATLGVNKDYNKYSNIEHKSRKHDEVVPAPQTENPQE